ncbi:MAG: glutamate racemase [Candidatus Omnitrophota bacterium]
MKSLKNRPIGIFDSGVGGLTVARSVRKELPDEDIIYFGDTARVPYGNKSKDTIIRFSREIMSFMMDMNVKMVVIACNTASSLSLASLKRYYSIPVVGVINPGVEEALRLSKSGRIGVIGTSSTVSSGTYGKELKRNDPSCKVFSKSCPLFVPLVENRFFSSPVTRQVAGMYLKDLKKKKIDTLILGCTHYPILKTVIGKTMGSTKLVDSSLAVAKYVKKILEKDDLKTLSKKKGKTRYYVSDDPKGFSKVAGIFLKEKIKANKANL